MIDEHFTYDACSIKRKNLIFNSFRSDQISLFDGILLGSN